jgi:hypothetical protein
MSSEGPSTEKRIRSAAIAGLLGYGLTGSARGAAVGASLGGIFAPFGGQTVEAMRGGSKKRKMSKRKQRKQSPRRKRKQSRQRR